MFQNLFLSIQRHWVLCTILMLTGITIASLFPAEQLPPVPGTDKTHHFIAYGLLIYPMSLAKPKHFVLFAILLALFGGVIELIQPYVNRYGEWQDLLANCLGLFLGFLLGQITAWALKRN